MRHTTLKLAIFAAAILAVLPIARMSIAQSQHKDYLSDEEADKIRDAGSPGERIKLYVSFADDRMKKFDYELNRSVPERRRGEILNGLLNGYEGCIDDAADQIDVAEEKQINIHEELKLIQTKGKEFLDQLKKYDQGGPELDSYRDTLEDAIDGTTDALSDAAEAQKEMTPGPVRRKK